jgi:hypothetical protein
MPNLPGNASITGRVTARRALNNAKRNIILFLRYRLLISPHFCLDYLSSRVVAILSGM